MGNTVQKMAGIVASMGIYGTLLVALTGCAIEPYKAYDGPVRSRTEVATLLTSDDTVLGIPGGETILISVDGRNLQGEFMHALSSAYVAVLPGRHSVTAGYRLIGVSRQVIEVTTLTATLESGKRYVVRGRTRSLWTNKHGANIWIVDKSSRTIIAGVEHGPRRD